MKWKSSILAVFLIPSCLSAQAEVDQLESLGSELWIQKTPAGPINYYKLAGVSQDSDVLNGLVDREGFLP
jgi:hypothetical protein